MTNKSLGVQSLHRSGDEYYRYIMFARTSVMARKNIRSLLEGGDRRSIGRADHIAKIVLRDSTLFPKLMAGLWSKNPLVRMRAADAAEKVTRDNPALLQPFKKELLGLMAETTQQELRWHLAAMIPRLAL